MGKEDTTKALKVKISLTTFWLLGGYYQGSLGKN